jgi:TolB-like protein
VVADAAKPIVAMAPVPDEEFLAALKKILASRQFSKAHRCTALLAYLVQRAVNRDDPAPLPEHEIGVAVFGRDRMTYFTGDDPIVRVQAGRLRLRLAAYYAEEGCAEPLRISIPSGSYQPKVERVAVRAPAPLNSPLPLLMFRPLSCLSSDPQLSSYALGLNDELGYRLYRALPSVRRIDAESPLAALAALSGLSNTTLLEGTVRHDAARVRVSLLLRRVSDGAVLWYEQFDDASSASIAAQEGMAERCVQALHQYLPA